MSMDPIIGNSLSNTCDNPISSNCVAWAGGNVNGLCQGASLTQVVQQAVNATTPVTSCYTGTWIDFTTSVPGSGSNGGGVSWTIGSFGTPFGGSGSISGAENNPQYKWTRDGNLEIRGSFFFNVTPVAPITNVFVQIPIATITTSCFVAIGALSQTHLISTDSFASGNSIIIATRGHLTINPITGVLFFNFSYAQPTPAAFSVQVFMGGTTFNLA